MNGVEEITVTKSEARAKYREYRAAAERQPLPYLKELKDAYNQLRRGHGVIDVFKAFRNCGTTEDGLGPKLAIYPATETKCWFQRERLGGGKFCWSRASRNHKNIIELAAGTFPEWTSTDYWTMVSCPVPIVPPHLLPRAELSNFHILWEVEKWNLEAPRDPLLLRRISTNLFAIVARWDLTELERAVIAGRIR